MAAAADTTVELSTIADLLNILQAERGLASDNQLSKVLGVPQQTISTWRSGRFFPSDERCLVLAEALKIEPSVVLTIVGAERARGTKAEAAWRSLRRFAAGNSKRATELARQIARAGGLAAFVLGAQMGLFSSPASVAGANSAPAQCILSKIKRIRRKAA